jgi:hypothetical protein
MSRPQRIELLVFFACFFSYAFFHQGGGWNQNARFAEVRAIVEEGRFAIDNFLVYEPVSGRPVLQRALVENGEYGRDGKRFRLSWVDMDWRLFPVSDAPRDPETENTPLVEVCASGDIGYVPWSGHFHPNKPPGTSFAGVPGYFVLYHAERLLGLDPDHWWILTLNAWLTSVCSVGLASALGCVMFFRLARHLGGGRVFPALLTTLALGFGTTFFPFATLFFDHSLCAAFLIGGFYFLYFARQRPEGTVLGGAVAAGVCAGFGAVTNYLAAVAVLFLGVYALLAPRSDRWDWRAAAGFSLGVLGPFLLICAYGWACFGSPFRLNNDFQNPLFNEAGRALFGMFAIPDSLESLAKLGYVGSLIAFSPFRGVFFLCPVLVLALPGFWVWLRDKHHLAEARLCLAIFGFFFFANMTFNGYQAGHSAGPRYLVPGLPFLALGLVVAFERWRKMSLLLGFVSLGNQLLLTATDAQNPAGVGGHARVEGRREEWGYRIVADYAWPLFAAGRAWPILDGQLELHMEKESGRIAGLGEEQESRVWEETRLRAALRESISRGEPSPFLLGSIVGPVSVNPVGVFEGMLTYGSYPPGSPQCRWASFNVGEFLFPESRWSLLPWALAVGGGAAFAVHLARRASTEGGL